uniref:Uncharacterized protein n=1 Tax=Timema shepardi TaxID=629360 RepID=A0A7R9G5E5_TIMSH|nr:unnamed protein product [Timema shepardi]
MIVYLFIITSRYGCLMLNEHWLLHQKDLFDCPGTSNTNLALWLSGVECDKWFPYLETPFHLPLLRGKCRNPGGSTRQYVGPTRRVETRIDIEVIAPGNGGFPWRQLDGSMRRVETRIDRELEWFKMDKLQQLVNMVDTVQTVKLCDLTVDQKYSVDKLKAVNTKFGRRLIAYLDGEFCVFLPCRFGTLTDEDVCELNKEKLVFTCAGVKPGMLTMLRTSYINLMFVGHTIAGRAYMTVENVHSVAVSDRHVIYKVEQRGYIEFCDSTRHTIRATEVLPYKRIEETYMCDMTCTVYNFCKGDDVAMLPRPPPPLATASAPRVTGVHATRVVYLPVSRVTCVTTTTTGGGIFLLLHLQLTLCHLNVVDRMQSSPILFGTNITVIKHLQTLLTRMPVGTRRGDTHRDNIFLHLDDHSFIFNKFVKNGIHNIFTTIDNRKFHTFTFRIDDYICKSRWITSNTNSIHMTVKLNIITFPGYIVRMPGIFSAIRTGCPSVEVLSLGCQSKISHGVIHIKRVEYVGPTTGPMREQSSSRYNLKDLDKPVPSHSKDFTPATPPGYSEYYRQLLSTQTVGT